MGKKGCLGSFGVLELRHADGFTRFGVGLFKRWFPKGSARVFMRVTVRLKVQGILGGGGPIAYCIQARAIKIHG